MAVELKLNRTTANIYYYSITTNTLGVFRVGPIGVAPGHQRPQATASGKP